MTIALIVALIVVINAATFWLFYKRTNRLLFRYRRELTNAFTSIETRLARGAEDLSAENAHGVWAVMFSYNRGEMARRTIESLRRHEPNLPLLVIDNGSTNGTQEMLLGLQKTGVIQKLLLNTWSDVPQWQKCFALAQALKMLSLERPSHFIWLDDDLEVTKPFLAKGLELLEKLRNESVRLISFVDDGRQEYVHGTLKTLPVQLDGTSQPIKLRKSFNGNIILVAMEFFEELGYPPVAEGINDLAVEDWYYSRRMEAHGYLAAVYPAVSHIGDRSEREALDAAG